MNKFENQEFKEAGLGYNPETLKPILKYPDVIKYFPDRKIEAIRDLRRKSGAKGQPVYLPEAQQIIEEQWQGLNREEDPELEKKFRFTPDGREIYTFHIWT